jgi:hypothetical protein
MVGHYSTKHMINLVASIEVIFVSSRLKLGSMIVALYLSSKVSFLFFGWNGKASIWFQRILLIYDINQKKQFK